MRCVVHRAVRVAIVPYLCRVRRATLCVVMCVSRAVSVNCAQLCCVSYGVLWCCGAVVRCDAVVL